MLGIGSSVYLCLSFETTDVMTSINYSLLNRREGGREGGRERMGSVYNLGFILKDS